MNQDKKKVALAWIFRLIIALAVVKVADIGWNKIMYELSDLKSANKVLHEQYIAASQEGRLVKIVDEKMGKKAPVEVKVKVTRTIYQLSQAKGIPLSFICGLIEVESGWDPKVTSSVGAKGLMQIMPSTAMPYVRYERRDYNSDILYDPVVNVIVGISYIADLHAEQIELKHKDEDYRQTLLGYNHDQNYPGLVLKTAQKYKDLGLE